MLTAAMEKFGIKEVDPTDQPFNPALHQAVSMQESREKAPNTVLTVLQKGYQLNDRLVRPAMVIVAKGTEAPPAGEVDEQA
jgi:molecular chaperone GrpE